MEDPSRANEQFSRFDDEEARFSDDGRPPKNRGKVVRMALFYSIWAGLLSLLIITGLFNIIFRGNWGFLVMLSIGLFFGALAWHQAINYLRDLSARPVIHEGDILRKWHKGNLFFFLLPSYYIMVERRVFTVSRSEYAMLLEDDLVRITCFPHSLTVEQVERYDPAHRQFLPAALGSS